MKQQYMMFDDLPQWVQEPVRTIRGGDEHTWVFQPVPALEGHSIIGLMNQGEEGECLVRAYLNKVIGKFL